jgi:hypothetical protein
MLLSEAMILRSSVLFSVEKEGATPPFFLIFERGGAMVGPPYRGK